MTLRNRCHNGRSRLRRLHLDEMAVEVVESANSSSRGRGVLRCRRSRRNSERRSILHLDQHKPPLPNRSHRGHLVKPSSNVRLVLSRLNRGLKLSLSCKPNANPPSTSTLRTIPRHHSHLPSRRRSPVRLVIPALYRLPNPLDLRTYLLHR